MSIKEIKTEAKSIYNRSSHYIVGTFIASLIVIGIVNNILDVLGTVSGISLLSFFAIFLSPMSAGMYKASLQAYKHEANQVTTKAYTLLGLKHYRRYFGLVGTKLLGDFLGILIMAMIVFVLGLGTLGMTNAVEFILSGNLVDIVGFGTVSMVFAILISLALSVVVSGYLTMTDLMIVEKEMPFKKALSASLKLMKGHLWHYLLIRLSYVPHAILTAIIVNVFSISLNTLFNQLLTITPSLAFIYSILMNVLLAVISTFAGVMIYQVKQQLAVVVLYKKIENEKSQD